MFGLTVKSNTPIPRNELSPSPAFVGKEPTAGISTQVKTQTPAQSQHQTKNKLLLLQFPNSVEDRGDEGLLNYWRDRRAMQSMVGIRQHREEKNLAPLPTTTVTSPIITTCAPQALELEQQPTALNSLLQAPSLEESISRREAKRQRGKMQKAQHILVEEEIAAVEELPMGGEGKKPFIEGVEGEIDLEAIADIFFASPKILHHYRKGHSGDAASNEDPEAEVENDDELFSKNKNNFISGTTTTSAVKNFQKMGGSTTRLHTEEIQASMRYLNNLIEFSALSPEQQKTQIELKKDAEKKRRRRGPTDTHHHASSTFYTDSEVFQLCNQVRNEIELVCFKNRKQKLLEQLLRNRRTQQMTQFFEGSHEDWIENLQERLRQEKRAKRKRKREERRHEEEEENARIRMKVRSGGKSRKELFSEIHTNEEHASSSSSSKDSDDVKEKQHRPPGTQLPSSMDATSTTKNKNTPITKSMQQQKNLLVATKKEPVMMFKAYTPQPKSEGRLLQHQAGELEMERGSGTPPFGQKLFLQHHPSSSNEKVSQKANHDNNTEKGKIYGYNSDAIGVGSSLPQLKPGKSSHVYPSSGGEMGNSAFSSPLGGVMSSSDFLLSGTNLRGDPQTDMMMNKKLPGLATQVDASHQGLLPSDNLPTPTSQWATAMGFQPPISTSALEMSGGGLLTTQKLENIRQSLTTQNLGPGAGVLRKPPHHVVSKPVVQQQPQPALVQQPTAAAPSMERKHNSSTKSPEKKKTDKKLELLQATSMGGAGQKEQQSALEKLAPWRREEPQYIVDVHGKKVALNAEEGKGGEMTTASAADKKEETTTKPVVVAAAALKQDKHPSSVKKVDRSPSLPQSAFFMTSSVGAKVLSDSPIKEDRKSPPQKINGDKMKAEAKVQQRKTQKNENPPAEGDLSKEKEKEVTLEKKDEKKIVEVGGGKKVLTSKSRQEALAALNERLERNFPPAANAVQQAAQRQQTSHQGGTTTLLMKEGETNNGNSVASKNKSPILARNRPSPISVMGTDQEQRSSSSPRQKKTGTSHYMTNVEEKRIVRVKFPTEKDIKSPPSSPAPSKKVTSPLTGSKRLPASPGSPLGKEKPTKGPFSPGVTEVKAADVGLEAEQQQTEEIAEPAPEVPQFAGVVAADTIVRSRLSEGCPSMPPLPFPKPVWNAQDPKPCAVVVVVNEYSDPKIQPLPDSAVHNAFALSWMLQILGYKVFEVGEVFTKQQQHAASPSSTVKHKHVNRDGVLGAVKHALIDASGKVNLQPQSSQAGSPTKGGASGSPKKENLTSPMSSSLRDNSSGIGAKQSNETPAVIDTGVCFVYIVGRGAEGKLHGYDTTLHYLLHQDTKINALSRHNTLIVEEIIQLKNAASGLQPIVMSEIYPLRVELKGIEPEKVGLGMACIMAGTKLHGSDMNIYYPPRVQPGAFTWYLLKGLQGDAVRSGTMTPSLLNAFVKDSLYAHFVKLFQKDQGLSFANAKLMAETHLVTEASFQMRASHEASHQLVTKDRNMFRFKQELQARKALSVNTQCRFLVECLVDVAYLKNIQTYIQNLWYKIEGLFFPKGKFYSSPSKRQLKLLQVFRSGNYHVLLDPKEMGLNMHRVIVEGGADDEVEALTGCSCHRIRDYEAALNDLHQMPVDYQLHSSQSDLVLWTAPKNGYQRQIKSKIFQKYYEENFRKIAGFTIVNIKEKVSFYFSGCERDFLEFTKHGVLGSFCTPQLFFTSVQNVGYQQLVPPYSFDQAGSMRQTTKGGGSITKKKNVVPSRVPPSLVANTSFGPEFPSPTSAQNEQPKSLILQEQQDSFAGEGGLCSPKTATAPPVLVNTSVEKIFRRISSMQARWRAYVMRKSYVPRVDWSTNVIFVRRVEDVEKPETETRTALKYRELESRRAVIEFNMEPRVRSDLFVLEGELWYDIIILETRFVLRVQEPNRREQLDYLEERARVDVEEAKWRDKKFVQSLQYSRLLQGGVKMFAKEMEQRERMESIEEGDRMTLKGQMQQQLYRVGLKKG